MFCILFFYFFLPFARITQFDSVFDVKMEIGIFRFNELKIPSYCANSFAKCNLKTSRKQQKIDVEAEIKHKILNNLIETTSEERSRKPLDIQSKLVLYAVIQHGLILHVCKLFCILLTVLLNRISMQRRYGRERERVSWKKGEQTTERNRFFQLYTISSDSITCHRYQRANEIGIHDTFGEALKR